MAARVRRVLCVCAALSLLLALLLCFSGQVQADGAAPAEPSCGDDMEAVVARRSAEGEPAAKEHSSQQQQQPPTPEATPAAVPATPATESVPVAEQQQQQQQQQQEGHGHQQQEEHAEAGQEGEPVAVEGQEEGQEAEEGQEIQDSEEGDAPEAEDGQDGQQQEGEGGEGEGAEGEEGAAEWQESQDQEEEVVEEDQVLLPVHLADVMYLVRTEPVTPHTARFEHMRVAWGFADADAEDLQRLLPSYVLGKDAWALRPVLPQLVHAMQSVESVRWLVVLDDEADIVDTNALAAELGRFDAESQSVFLGRALRDSKHAIIHHYSSDFTFQYPAFSSGFAISKPLLVQMAASLKPENLTDFTIDAAYELARFIQRSSHSSPPEAPVLLTDSPIFCAGRRTHNHAPATSNATTTAATNSSTTAATSTVPTTAATTATTTSAPAGTATEGAGESGAAAAPAAAAEPEAELVDDGTAGCAIVAYALRDLAPPVQAVTPGDIFVAVKTAAVFHQTRLRNLIDTWGSKAPLIEYFSETADPSIPTRATGVPNTEVGHCGKLRAILLYAAEHHTDKPWLAVVDDDTSLSLPRLASLLSLYDPTEPIFLGERYGYALGHAGYSYITGGGGMIFSRAAIKAYKDSSCRCPKDDSPDDMLLGSCFYSNNWHIIHNPGFHQSVPSTYHPSLLDEQTVISFHKCMKPADCEHHSLVL